MGEIEEPVKITKVHNVRNLRRIDETLINKLFGTLPNEIVSNLVRKKLPKPNKRRQQFSVDRPNIRLTDRLKDIVISLGLNDEPSMDRRAELVLGYCRYKDYTYNTTVRYFNTLKRFGMFGKSGNETNVRPDSLAFADNGKLHIRVVRIEDFTKLVQYLHKNFSEYTAPLLMAAYSGLRSSELLQLSMYSLYQLKSRMMSISIRRKHTVITSLDKQTTHWTPIYNTYLNDLINALITLYNEPYTVFIERGINTLLFNVSPKTLSNRIQSLYAQAVGARPPHGFGVHSCRNMISIMMAQDSNNMVAISEFLQHKSLKYTRRYVKADFTHVTKEFNRLTNHELASVRGGLEEILEKYEPTQNEKPNNNK